MRTKIFISIIIVILLGTVAVRAASFYLDPNNGDTSNTGSIDNPWSSLDEVINANLIRTKAYSPLPFSSNSQLMDKNLNGTVNAGDTLILMSGLHGAVFLQNYINDVPITIRAMEGHAPIIERIHLQACKNWNIEGVQVSSEPYGYYLNYRLVYIESHSWQGPSTHIQISNCQIFSTNNPWSVAQDWVDKVSSGIYVKGDSCVITDNIITNIDMGLTCLGDYITAERNQIINFSGDGGRILGSHIKFNYNVIKNCYAVNGNHDDGIQSFTTNGYVVDNNEVIGNLIINTDDPNRPLNGILQGIGCFDGFFNDWYVANNVISVNHWHGITFLGANRCTLIHNTVLDPSPQITPGGSWVRIDDHKDGTPSSDCLVANNVANSFVVDGNEVSNIAIDVLASYDDHFVAPSAYNFELIATSTLIDAADLNYSISYDFDDKIRDAFPDIGAFEFTDINTSIYEAYEKKESIIYPNPFRESVHLSKPSACTSIALYDTKGRLCFTGDIDFINNNISTLKPGMYYFLIFDGENYTLESVFKM